MEVQRGLADLKIAQEKSMITQHQTATTPKDYGSAH